MCKPLTKFVKSGQNADLNKLKNLIFYLKGFLLFRSKKENISTSTF